MENVLELSLKDAAMLAINQKLILQSVGWEVYEQVLKQYQDSNEVHFAYDDGFLEVEVPLSKHEIPIGVLSDLITTICVEKGIDFRNVRSTTFRQQAKLKGCEPDTAFYIQNESSVRGLIDIDLSRNPPPDLVIEVDVTSPSLNKLPIYAALGVSEVWLYKGDKVTFYKLYGDFYQETPSSVALPFLNNRIVTEFLQKGAEGRTLSWFRELRKWINNND